MQQTMFVLHGETVFGGHVRCLTRQGAELQPLDEDGQEEEDLMTGNGLPYTAPFAQTENEHLLPLCLVELGSIGTQEAAGVKDGRFLPKIPAGNRSRTCSETLQINISGSCWSAVTADTD